MMTIEEMRKRKRQLEYTNAQLSNMTDIPLGTLNKILSGATKHPRPENLKALEKVLQDPERVVLGGPDFVLEVVSPSSVLRDYLKKATKYETAGVREYWIVDPLSRRILTYDFTEGSAPDLYPLSGKVGVAIYNKDLQIDFNEYQELLRQDTQSS